MLIIEETKRRELTKKGIVICSVEKDAAVIDVIDDSHESQYPDFEKIAVVEAYGS